MKSKNAMNISKKVEQIIVSCIFFFLFIAKNLKAPCLIVFYETRMKHVMIYICIHETCYTYVYMKHVIHMYT